MRLAGRATLVALFIVIAVVAGWLIRRELFAWHESAKERAVLSALRIGETRAALYDYARSAGALPINVDFITWGPDGRALTDGSFPKPNSAHPHPAVTMTFAHRGGLFLRNVDDIDVAFDRYDRIVRWTVKTHETGV